MRTKEEAIEHLREILKPGDTVQLLQRHCSRSGMTRSVSLFAVMGAAVVSIDEAAALAIGASINRRHGGIYAGGEDGAGLVNALATALWPEGFGCTGKGDGEPRHWCPSSDHGNGDRDYTPHGHRTPCDAQDHATEAEYEACTDCHGGRQHWHRDSGYALRYRWL